VISKLFRRTYSIDAEYMPIFVGAYQAVTSHATYDYVTDFLDILETMRPESIDRTIELLVERGTPLKVMFSVRERLRTRKPTDRRFSTNLHRRMIKLIDWQEQELKSVFALATIDPADLSERTNREYFRLSRASHATSGRVEHYGRAIKNELEFIYERFPELRPYLAPIFEAESLAEVGDRFVVRGDVAEGVPAYEASLKSTNDSAVRAAMAEATAPVEVTRPTAPAAPDESPLLVQTVCPHCQCIFDHWVRALAYRQWQAGWITVLDAFPHLAPDDHERLRTGTCPACRQLAASGGRDDAEHGDWRDALWPPEKPQYDDWRDRLWTPVQPSVSR
jgi:hypothetical protein